MIHASVLMIDPKRGSAEDENNTKDYYDPFLGVDFYNVASSIDALSSGFPTHRAAHHPDVHRFAKKASAATSGGGGVVGGMNGSNLNKPFGPHFRRVWVQGEVTSSANNGAVLVVSDGTGSVEVNTDGERKIEKGAYVCAMGWLSKEKKVQATHVMVAKMEDARRAGRFVVRAHLYLIVVAIALYVCCTHFQRAVSARRGGLKLNPPN